MTTLTPHYVSPTTYNRRLVVGSGSELPEDIAGYAGCEEFFALGVLYGLVAG